MQGTTSSPQATFDLFAELARSERRLSRVMETFTPNPRSKLTEKEQYYSFYTGDVDTTVVDEEEPPRENVAIDTSIASLQRHSKDELITMFGYDDDSDMAWMMNEWLREQPKDTVMKILIMNDRERSAYYAIHGPMNDESDEESIDV